MQEEGEAAPRDREPELLDALPSSLSSLTKRERELLALIASGASNKEIAEELSITNTTVAKHATNIYRKLGVKNRTEAASRYFTYRLTG